MPKEVRHALGANPGDELVYEIAGNVVTLRKAQPFDRVWHQSLVSQLGEWNSEENDEAWGDL